MSLMSRRRLLVAFFTSLIILETIAYVTVTPRPSEQFFQLYVLGNKRLLSDYYPNNDANIRLRDQVRWYVGVTDFMGSVQLVVIRIKLGNQTISPPNDAQAQPSPAPLITEFWRFVQDNETWEMPFFWQVVNADERGGSTSILEMRINNGTYQIANLSAVDGYNFRLILELWTWETESGALQFGWSSGSEQRVAWVQVWFNMTTPVHQ